VLCVFAFALENSGKKGSRSMKERPPTLVDSNSPDATKKGRSLTPEGEKKTYSCRSSRENPPTPATNKVRYAITEQSPRLNVEWRRKGPFGDPSQKREKGKAGSFRQARSTRYETFSHENNMTRKKSKKVQGPTTGGKGSVHSIEAITIIG